MRWRYRSVNVVRVRSTAYKEVSALAPEKMQFSTLNVKSLYCKKTRLFLGISRTPEWSQTAGSEANSSMLMEISLERVLCAQPKRERSQ